MSSQLFSFLLVFLRPCGPHTALPSARACAALVDLFTVEVPDEGRGQLSIVPNGFQGRRPSWWTEVVRAAASAATGEHHVSGEDAQPGDWCVLF